ncbi:uncharacterized protein C19orf47 homolog [Bolinopsis microptera]|uniref:uncharacterized protein C19orf47 homolog n=1 Tax=Bolinopsis microptera TaxID=2820187 RepID=UPI00307A3454
MSRGYWKKFLIDAGIPVKAADSYTSSFVDNRISESMVPDLSKSVLIDLGITIIGDVIAILKHAIHVTEEASAERKERNSKKQKPEKRRPSSERKSKKVEPEKKAETIPAPLKKTEEKQAAKI